MPQFRYKARSSAGVLIEGSMDAASADLVADQLQAGGSTPVRITEEARKAAGQAGLRWQFGGRRIDPEDLILFCRQMYSLTRAGVPMLRALRGMIESSGLWLLAK